MKIPMLKTSSLLAAASIFVGCENMTPLENAGVFGAASGAAAGGIARASGASVGESVAIGAATGAVVAAAAYVISKHQATERQHRIAEERARQAYAEMSAKKKAEMKARKTRYIAVDTEKSDQTAAGAKKSVMRKWSATTSTISRAHRQSVPRPSSTRTRQSTSVRAVNR